ncbi:MAG: hypothetical protein AVDCRST_MAG01-01-786 [uncultured Rubrobacteraceae bacterium]|uniref:Uncharacterized protein n=1 Tax=uncultured Rubrobacteraceae bacterium TaxID=349277 RepID=A0A6J4NS13_9ACTN|nr:MAG: hypothetical protein AVDCRST_MAG01-01-786 [uncultured Rubrobacteraceae bacterium]
MRAIDQTRLPEDVILSVVGTLEEFAEAISSLRAPGVMGDRGTRRRRGRRRI